MSEQYYIRVRGKVQGPFTAGELQRLASRGRFARHHQVSADKQKWHRASEFPELLAPPNRPERFRRPVEVEGEVVEVEPIETVDPLGSSDEYGLAPLEAQPAPDAFALETPGVSHAAPSSQEWYFTQGEKECGPATFFELQNLVASGQVTRSDSVWTEGFADWRLAGEVRELFPDAPTAGVDALRINQPLTQHARANQTAPMALASFVAGLLGTSVLFFVGSIAAIILGHIALNQIRDSGDELGGRPMAFAGLVLGYMVVIGGTLTFLIVILASLAASG